MEKKDKKEFIEPTLEKINLGEIEDLYAFSAMLRSGSSVAAEGGGY